MRLAVILALVAATSGCRKKTPAARPLLGDPVASFDGDPLVAMRDELADQVLASYGRDEPPDVETRMISRAIGPARIGVGPGDVLVTADDFARAPSRWPLYLGHEAKLDLQSKRLAVELAADRSAAWVSDEVSWRIPACGRTAVVPMRMTALFAHDGDRWVPVYEHLSFARPPVPDAEGLIGKAIKSASVDRDLSDALSHAVARTPGFVAPDATLIGPTPDDLWRGPEAIQSIPPVLVAEDRRIGLVGRVADTATVAYWIGNFVIDVPARGGKPAGKVRVRGTFAFERRLYVAPGQTPPTPAPKCSDDPKACRWLLVQAHVSAPIRDLDLATGVFGVSLATPYVSDQPLSLSCD